jgi:hypothetical protein
VLVAKCGWQGNAEWEAERARLQIGVLAPQRKRLIAKHRCRRPPTRHLLNLEQALDLFIFVNLDSNSNSQRLARR